MDKEMIARCGTYCGICVWKDQINCLGCKGQNGKMFYGECDKALCCVGRGYEHCGQCPEMPCEKLLDLFNDPEHGDKGARLHNLQAWAGGNYIYEKLR